MNKLLSASFAVACVSAIHDHKKINAVDCPTNIHSVGPLPYFDANETQPCSYAGTLPSNAEGTHHMFYWMYPSAVVDAPYAIWLNGGPGASSTFANFLMNGPMRIYSTGTGVDDYLVNLAPQGSWVDAATMIYIDQPVGTGFSFGEPLLTNMDEASDEFIYFLTQLFTMYPEMEGADLYMTGESYSGKYLPKFTYEMLQYNIKQAKTYFNLKATLCGDPYTAPVTQRTHMHIVPDALNVIDDSNMPQIAAMERRCEEMAADPNYSSSDKGDTCANIMGYITGVSGDVFPYDTRIFGSDWDKVEDPTTNYFTISGKFQEALDAINVSDSTKSPVFCMSCGPVGEAFADDQLLDYSWYLQQLIDTMNYPFLLYAGEFDAQDGPKTQEFWLRRMSFTGDADFWSQSRQVYWVNPADGSEAIVGGYWREGPTFSYLTVPKAGHFVPANNYWPAYSFFTDYIANQKLSCHNSVDGCSTVAFRCSMMNDCSGNGTCGSNGQCTCNSGWKSADCSMESTTLSGGANLSLAQHGPKYYSFRRPGSVSAIVEFMSEQPMDVYVSKGADSDPTQFSNDIRFQDVTLVRLSSWDFDVMNSSEGYSVTVYSASSDEGANTFLDNTLTVKYSEYFARDVVKEAASKTMDAAETMHELSHEVRDSDTPVKTLIDGVFSMFQ